eukprot:492308-Hanusia_phi.AAC.1
MLSDLVVLNPPLPPVAHVEALSPVAVDHVLPHSRVRSAPDRHPVLAVAVDLQASEERRAGVREEQEKHQQWREEGNSGGRG